MGQFAFSEEEDDGSFVESMKNQSDQGDVEELPVQQLGTGFSDEEDDGSFVMPEQDDFEDAEIAIPEDQQRPVVETLDGQKNNTHIREDVEEEQSDRSLIGRAYDDIKGFVTSPVEVLSTVPRAVSGGLGELTQFIGDLDLKRQQLTGTLKFDLGEDQKFNISDLFQIPEYVSPSEVKKEVETKQYNGVYYNISDKLEQARNVFPEPETVTGQISEELLKFFVGIKGVDKVTKLGSGLKGLYVNSAITSAVFFDPEEEWLANTLNEFESVAPFVPDILVSSENKDVFENRLAKALESAVLIAPFQIPALTKALGNVYSHLDNIRIAKLEQLKEGAVSETTRKALDKSREALMGTDIPPKVELLNGVLIKAGEKGERIKRARAKEIGIELEKKAQNAKIADENKEMYNKLVDEFEQGLTVNRSNSLKAGDDGFFTVTDMVGGRKVINMDKIRQAKDEMLQSRDVKSEKGMIGKASREITMEGYESVDDITYLDADTVAKITQDEIDELSIRVLTTENVEALTTVAAELKKIRPDLWNDKKTVTKNIFDLVVKNADELSVNNGEHPVWKALDKAGMSFEDFVVSNLGSASEAGRILNKYSQLAKRVKPKSIKQQEELDAMLKNENNMVNYFRRVENIRRGLLVSQVATAARNLQSGLLRTPVEAINNIMETAMYDLSRGKFVSNRVFKRATWQDSLSGLRYIYSDRKTAEEYTDYILGNKDLKKFYDQMYNTINEIQLNQGKGTGTGADKVLTKIEDFTQLLNTPNRMQDFMIRRATFLSEAQRLFRQRWDMDLMEALDNGRLKDILRDSSDLNKNMVKKKFVRKYKKGMKIPAGKNIGDTYEVEQLVPESTAMEIFADATQRALDVTYAGSPETALGQGFANFVTKYGLTVIAPFPRFMAKSIELMAENSAGAFVPTMRRIVEGGKIGLGKVGIGKGGKLKPLTERESRMISRNITGVAGIYAASQMLEETGMFGENYKLVPLGDGKVLDVTPLFPLRQFFMLGYIGKQWAKAKEDTNSVDAAIEAFVETFPRREWAETFLGSGFRVGVGGEILDDFARMFSSEDLSTKENLGRQLGGAAGNYFSSFFVPLNQILDGQRALGSRGTVYRESATNPELVPSFLDATVKGFVKPFKRYDLRPHVEDSLPIKQDIFQEKRERIGPGFKVALGLNMFSQDEEEGRFMNALGFTKFDLSSKSRIPEVKNFENEIIRRVLPFIVQEAFDLVGEKEEEYENNREALSQTENIFTDFSPQSKESYVKTEVRSFVEDLVNSVRGNEETIGILDDKDKVIELMAMTKYRKLPMNIRDKANNAFTREYKRRPFKYSEELMRSQFRDYDTFSDEEKAIAEYNMKLRDLQNLGVIGDELKKIQGETRRSIRN
tara:strand:+ start:820 stop:4953 length:4134 start_codon:yes stop_codon:yes gene_type:complete